MRISTENFYSFFFSELRPFWTYRFGQNERNYWKFVSATPLKPLNRISWNFVVMKDIMCRYAFLQEMLIWSFISFLNFGQNYFVQLTQMKLVFCPIACHSCLELPFIVYSILRQCLSVGYLSLLTLSFIEICFCHTCIFFLASSIEIRFCLIFGLMLYQLIQLKLLTVQYQVELNQDRDSSL